MRIFIVLVLFCTIFLSLVPPARASSWTDFLCWFYPCTGNGAEDFSRPYLEDGKIPHLAEWPKDDWVPEDWIESRGSAKAVMDGLYQGGVITDQSTDWRSGAAELEVGQNFMRLSDRDKRRVVRFVDHVYGYTKLPRGTIQIYHKASGDSIGLYTVDGLQLQ